MEIEVVVEIPKGTRNKYEIDQETGTIWLDRMLFTSTRYPADYGFVPHTLAKDGDPPRRPRPLGGTNLSGLPYPGPAHWRVHHERRAR